MSPNRRSVLIAAATAAGLLALPRTASAATDRGRSAAATDHDGR